MSYIISSLGFGFMVALWAVSGWLFQLVSAPFELIATFWKVLSNML